MSYSDLVHLEAVARATVEYLVVWTTILVWDTLSTFPVEYRTVWTRDWTLLKVVFLLNRYGTIVLEIASATIILTPMSLQTCRRVYWIQPLTIVFVIVVCQAIMAIRIWAIYERGRKMGYLAVFPFTFDTVILALAAFRTFHVHRQFGVKIPILQRVLRDGLLYYLAITATHVVTTVLWFQTDITVKSFNVPASIVMPSLMCSRLILSLLSRKPDGPSIPSFRIPEEDVGTALARRVSILTRDRGGGFGPESDKPVAPRPEDDGQVDVTRSAARSIPRVAAPEPPSPRPSSPPGSTVVRPGLTTRPSLASRRSEQTLESVRSHKSQASSAPEPASVLAIQVTTETVVSVFVDECHNDASEAGARSGRSPARRARPTSHPITPSPASTRESGHSPFSEPA
ncbi:hypothetical protein JCM11491_005683 [Sporobolomyces phaffii]